MNDNQQRSYSTWAAWQVSPEYRRTDDGLWRDYEMNEIIRRRWNEDLTAFLRGMHRHADVMKGQGNATRPQ